MIHVYNKLNEITLATGIIVLVVVVSVVSFAMQDPSGDFVKSAEREPYSTGSANTISNPESAEYIFVGTIKSKESSWNSQGTLIFSYMDVEVENSIQGDLAGVINVKKLGGKVGTVAQVIVGEPSYEAGDQIKFYATPSQEPGVLEVYHISSVSGEEDGEFSDSKGAPA